MRSKEGSSDYRYFPEPDLVPVAPTDEMRASARAALPELPAQRRDRYVSEWGVADHDARTLVDQPALARYAEAAVAAGVSGKDVANWCTGEILGFLNESGTTADALLLTPDGLAELIGFVADAAISRIQAKEVLAESLKTGTRPADVVQARGLAQVSDVGELGALVDEVLAANAEILSEWQAGDEKMRKKKRGALMGALMQASNKQGNPQVLGQLLDERLSAL